MLRRLVHRFNEEGNRESGAGAGDQRDYSKAVVAEIALNLDLEDEEDETERWIMEAGGSSGYERGMGGDARSTGRRVWVPDREMVWRIASVAGESADGISYTVQLDGGKGEVEFPIADCADYDPSHGLDLADASRMNQMHEAPLLDLINRRFRASNIYTNVADVLVSINPYTDIPGLYDIPMPVAKPPPIRSVRGPSPGSRVAERTAALMRGYGEDMNKGAANYSAGGGRPGDRRRKGLHGEGKEPNPKSQLTALKSMLGKPHVYGVADRAFQYMAETRGREVNGRIRKRNQSILITGESGAGKTEASKHVMRFLITASRALAGTPATSGISPPPNRGRSTGSRRTVSTVTSAAAAAKHMESVLLRSNTVLEAFGNAKTVRNDNSSRFGKYIKLQYDDAFRLVGARTEHFLLEKSRLVHLEENERSYHILYQVAKALPAKVKDSLGLQGGAESFTLLNQGNCLDASEETCDHEEFEAVETALSSLEFSASDKQDMWRLLAAVLHSGEMRFEDIAGKEQCRMTSGRDRGSVSPGELASLWGVDEAVFKAGVMRRTVTAGGTSASIALNAVQSKDNLLALLKHMYRQLFAWINWKINVVFDVPGGIGGGTKGVERTFIGILDIFGFEIMATNSFEQLCINFANEVLQKQFNHYVFVLEMEEYGAEGLDVESIPFRDNQSIIDLIAKRPAGLMPILEDQALTGRQAASLRASFTDKNLLELFHQQHHRKAPHPCYRKPRFDGPEFVVMHYAGDVTYCATGFLEKNNDTLQEDLRGLLLSSRIPFLRQLILGENGDFEQGVPSRAGVQSGSPNGTSDPWSPETSSSYESSGATPIQTAQVSIGSRKASPVAKRAGYPYLGNTRNGEGGLVSPASPLFSGSPDSGSPPYSSATGSKRAAKRGATAKIAAKTTVSNGFRRQLDDLVAQLGQTEPHYIKCIKPNASKAPGGWSSPLVIEQLRYSGVLEVVRIRREAFPMRVTYKQFYRRFGNLVSLKDRTMPSADDITLEQAKQAGLEICEKVFQGTEGGASFEMGKTKVFLRDDGLKRLRLALRRHYFDLAARIQALWRRAIARIRFAKQRAAAVQLQRVMRGGIARAGYLEARRAAVILQAICRMRNARKVYAQRLAAAVKVQAAWRGWRQRGWQKRTTSATRLQAVVRGYLMRNRQARRNAATRLQVSVAPVVKGFLARRRCKKYKSSIVELQAAFRGACARKQLARQLRERAAAEEARKDEAATLVAAVWRGSLQRRRNEAWMVYVIKIQSVLRGRTARAAYKAKVETVIRLQVAARTLLARKSFRTRKACALRAQTAIRSFLRNRRLRNRSIQVFDAARSSDVPAVARHLSEWPELLFVRDRHDAATSGKGLPSYSTLLHAACRGAATDVAALLEPFLADITAVDRWGNTSVHVAAAGCNYEVLKFLARRANLDITEAIRLAGHGHPAPEPEAFPLGMSKEAFSVAAAMVRRVRLEEAAEPSPLARGVYSWRKPRAVVAGHVDPNSCTPRQDGWAEKLEGEAWDEGRPIVEGYLRKRRETDRWLKRWCQLKHYSPPAGDGGATGPALFYFRKKSDAKPSKVIMLQHCLLKKSEHINVAFELHSPLMMEGKNTEGRLYFQAGDEVELQRWMVQLRVRVKFYDFKNEKRERPLEYLDLDRRRQLLRAENIDGKTPLHEATAFVGTDQNNGPQEILCAVQRTSTWLIENGADPNAYDAKGETPMHVAAEEGHGAVCDEMELRGGNQQLPRKRDGKTPRELAAEDGELAQLEREGVAPKGTVMHSAGVKVAPLLPPPSKLFGFTYVSMFLEKLSLPSSVGMTKPALTLSVYSSRGHLIEAAQDVASPSLTYPNYLWWAHTWHMRTPLETLGSGSIVIFELRDFQTPEKKVSCWGAMPLDRDLMNTQSELLSTYLPPTDPARLTQTGRTPGCYGLTGGSGGDTLDLPLSAEAVLGVDVSLTRVLQ